MVPSQPLPAPFIPPKVEIAPTARPWLFDVGCWMLDVRCSSAHNRKNLIPAISRRLHAQRPGSAAVAMAFLGPWRPIVVLPVQYHLLHRVQILAHRPRDWHAHAGEPYRCRCLCTRDAQGTNEPPIPDLLAYAKPVVPLEKPPRAHTLGLLLAPYH